MDGAPAGASPTTLASPSPPAAAAAMLNNNAGGGGHGANANNTQSIADYLAQLLKDKKQLAAFPNVFMHVERLLDDGKRGHAGLEEKKRLPLQCGVNCA